MKVTARELDEAMRWLDRKRGASDIIQYLFSELVEYGVVSDPGFSSSRDLQKAREFYKEWQQLSGNHKPEGLALRFFDDDELRPMASRLIRLGYAKPELRPHLRRVLDHLNKR